MLCKEKVRRIGDPLAVVIAETEAQAIAAVGKIKVTYIEMPAVFDAEEALKPDAPQVHDDVPNLIYHYKCRKGDVEKAFQEAHVVVENVYETPFADHAFLQLESGVAYMEKNGRVVVKASSQYPHFDRLEVAEAIGYDEEKVIIDNPAVGGAFGGREDLTLQPT